MDGQGSQQKLSRRGDHAGMLRPSMRWLTVMCSKVSDFRVRTGFGPAGRIAALAACVLLPRPCPAGETQYELWPEANAYFKLSSQLRLYLLLAPVYSPQSWTGDQAASFGELEVGSHLDISLKPFLRTVLRKSDWERERYFLARIGYTHLSNFAGAPESHENRVLLELTARFALPGEVWAVNRTRVDLRDKDGTSSTRLRDRLQLEREMSLFGAVTVPYVNVEPFYDSRYDAVVRWRYETGIEIVMNAHWRVEPHYLRQEDSQSEPRHTNAFGLVLKYYR